MTGGRSGPRGMRRPDWIVVGSSCSFSESDFFLLQGDGSSVMHNQVIAWLMILPRTLSWEVFTPVRRRVYTGCLVLLSHWLCVSCCHCEMWVNLPFTGSAFALIARLPRSRSL